MKPELQVKSDKYSKFELLAVLATGLLKFVFVDWLGMRAFYIVGICLFWLVYIFWRYSSDHSVLNSWGFKRVNFKQSLSILIPFFIICALIITVYGFLNKTILLNWNIIPVLSLYPAWGLLQQFIMLALIAGNLQDLFTFKLRKYHIILLTSFLFSMVHYPSVFLMIFTFIMEVIFVFVYLKWKNLWALGFIHGWTATLLLYFVLQRDLWSELFAWF